MHSINPDLWILLAAMIIAVYTTFQRRRIERVIISMLLCFTFFVEAVGTYYAWHSWNNLLFINCLSIVELALYTSFFYVTSEPGLQRKSILFSGFFVASICITDIFFITGYKAFHTYSYALSAVWLIFVGLWKVKNFLQNEKDELQPLTKDFVFWVTVAILFFYTGSLSVVVVLNSLSNFSKEIVRNMHTLLLNINSLYYLLLIIACLCPKRIPKSFFKQ
jgi:hypothetical protein